MATTPDPVNRFSGPVSVEEFQTWFDSDGRLVKESLMRQCLFEGNVEIYSSKGRLYLWYDSTSISYVDVDIP